MTYPEVKEIRKRLYDIETTTLLFDVGLDSTSWGEYPELYYFNVEIQLGEDDKETTVVELLIDENPEGEEIHLKKCDSRLIDEKYEQEQQEIYDTCKQILSDYLNGNLLKGEVEE